MKRKIFPLLLAALVLTGCAKAPVETVPSTAPVLMTQAAPTEPTTVPTTAPETQPETVPQTQPGPERFVLTFVGDCTLGANPNNYYAQLGFIKTVGEDLGYPFRNVLSYFEEDEATFVNLEGALCDSGNPMQKAHVFRGPTAYVEILTGGSVEMVSLANNHTQDYGKKGYETTLKTLEDAGIPYVERDASQILVTKNGLKIGLYGAVYYLLDVEDMTREIEELKEAGCDLIVAAPHWGTEYSYLPTEEQVEVGRAAIDAGADIVWGSHPHVLQPVEEYGDGLIFYSLGNFSFGGNADPGDLDTVLMQVEVFRDPDGTVRMGERIQVPCSVSSVEKINNYQPTPYQLEEEGYQRVLDKLSGSWK